MEIVIKIPDEVFEAYKDWDENKVATVEQTLIAHGTVLPKGHGRLIDADKLNKKRKYLIRTHSGFSPMSDWFIKEDDLFSAPTIIKADKEVKNE